MCFSSSYVALLQPTHPANNRCLFLLPDLVPNLRVGPESLRMPRIIAKLIETSAEVLDCCNDKELDMQTYYQTETCDKCEERRR